MSPAATQSLRDDDDLGFRPAAPDDNLGFRPAAQAQDNLGVQPAQAPKPTAPARPIKPFDYSAETLPERTEISPGVASQFEQPYTAVREPFGEPELSEASKQRIARERLEQGAHIGPGKPGVGGWLQDLESDIRSGTGATLPGRALRAMGAPGIESGVSPGVAETIGGPIIGPVRAVAGLKQALGPYAGERADVRSELEGLNEATRGAMQAAAPALIASPEALAALPAYGAAGELAQKGLEKAGVSPEAAELTSNIALIGGGLAHAGIEPRAPFGGLYESGASEPVIAGETAPGYLKGLTGKTAAAIDRTQRLERINAPVELPKLPETAAQPPILARAPLRTPMQELSEQAQSVRAPQEFRQQLTNEIADQIISRLRDEGVLEPPKTNVVDRRAVRPEDIAPYQPARKFIGGENIPPTVMPRADKLAEMRLGFRPAQPAEPELGFRPASEAERTGRLLPPAQPEDIEAQAAGPTIAPASKQPAARAAVATAAPQGITGDSRRVANLAIGRIGNPVEKQYARDVWQTIIGQGGVPLPPYGVTRVRADQIRDNLSDIARGNIAGRVPDPRTQFAPDVLDEAQAMMAHTHDFLSQQQRPGRYFADMGDETSLTGRGPKVPVTAVQSLRGQFPWFADLKESPADLARTLERGEGPAYDRLLTSAGDHIERSRQENTRMARSVEPDLEGMADEVRTLDPDLAAFLTDAAQGKISTWTETKQDQLAKIEEKISNARQAIEFGRAIDDLAGKERSATGGNAGEEEASAARRPESAGIDQTEAPGRRPEEIGGPILPGMEGAVAEQSRAAGVEQGKRLTEEANRPPESIESAAGEMETKSPLFRGTEASPQNETFPPRRGEGGFITPPLARDLLTARLTKDAYERLVAKLLSRKGWAWVTNTPRLPKPTQVLQPDCICSTTPRPTSGRKARERSIASSADCHASKSACSP